MSTTELVAFTSDVVRAREIPKGPILTEDAVSDELERLEDAIRVAREEYFKKQVTTARTIGIALKAIRDEKLYEERHPTFKMYVEEEWGFSDGRARDLIGHAAIVGSVAQRATLPPPVTERQTRLLRRYPEKYRAQIWCFIVNGDDVDLGTDPYHFDAVHATYMADMWFEENTSEGKDRADRARKERAREEEAQSAFARERETTVVKRDPISVASLALPPLKPVVTPVADTPAGTTTQPELDALEHAIAQALRVAPEQIVRECFDHVVQLHRAVTE